MANVSTMANLSRPWTAILEELSKCEVVCANCHRKRTAAQLRSSRYLDSIGEL